MPRIARIALLVAGIAYASWVLSPWLVPQMPLASSYASELAADGVPYREFFRWADRLSGLALVTAAGYFSGWMRAALAVWGIATLLDSISPMTCSPSLDAGCVLATQTFPTVQDTGHVVASSTATVASLAAVVVWWLQRHEHNRAVRVTTGVVVIATIMLVISSILTELGIEHQGLGYFQRAQLATLSVWTVMLARMTSSATSPASHVPARTLSRSLRR